MELYIASDIAISQNRPLSEYEYCLDKISDLIINRPSKNESDILIFCGGIIDNDIFINGDCMKILHKLFNLANQINIAIVSKISNRFDALSTGPSIIKDFFNIIYTSKSPLKYNIFFVDKEEFQYQGIMIMNHIHPNYEFNPSQKYLVIINDAIFDSHSYPKNLDQNNIYYLLTGTNKFRTIHPNIIYPGYVLPHGFDSAGEDKGICKIRADMKAEHIVIPSICAYIVIRISEGGILTDVKVDDTLNIYIKFIVDYMEPDILNKIVCDFVSYHKVKGYKIEFQKDKKNSKKKKFVINSESDAETIRSYSRSQGVDKYRTRKLLMCHESIQNEIRTTKNTTSKNISGNIKLLCMKFSNLLCYGRDNILDFRKYSSNSIISVRGKNYAGKSSIFDIILFGLFDKISRPGRENILNIRASDLECQIFFQKGNEYYLIYRGGKMNANGSLITSVYFYRVDKKNNIIENLTNTNKTKTNKTICEYVGTFNNYVSSTFVLHKNNDNILNEAPMQQKKDLCSLFNLDRYMDYAACSKDRIKKESSYVSDLKKRISKIELELKTIMESYPEVLNDNFLKKLLEYEKYICGLEPMTVPNTKYICKNVSDVKCLINNLAGSNDFLKLYELYELYFALDHNQSIEEAKKKVLSYTKYLDLNTKIMELKSKYKSALSRISTYELYRDIIHPNFIPFEILKSKLPIIEQSIRSKLKVFGDYDIRLITRELADEIVPDNDDILKIDSNLDVRYEASKVGTTSFKMFMCRSGNLTNGISSGCGLEKMIADIIFRLSIAEVSDTVKPNIFVIDEELSYFDKEYLPRIKKLLDMIKAQYEYVMIISHNDKINKFADYEIRLKRGENDNGFVNNLDPTLEPPPTKIERKKITKEDIKIESIIKI